MFNKKINKIIGLTIFSSQILSAVMPALTFAASQSVSNSDSKNALETVGTKANRLKTVGSSGVDESTGAFTYSYPIAVPKGKFDLEPSLNISYNSQSTENSIVGYGMNLSIPYIERTSKYGSDQMYTNTNVFVSSIGGELVLAPNSTTNYLQKFDDGSYQTYKFANNVWTLVDRNGYTYTFGSDNNSRLCDTNCTKVARWYLINVKDMMGNKITYTYEKKNLIVYPKEIWYTQDKNGNFSNKVVFEREVRQDVERSYKYGFLTSQDDRIKRIYAYSDNNLVAQVDLTYGNGSNGTRSILATIGEARKGTDNATTTMPVTTFTYQNDATINRSASVSVTSGQSFQDITGDGKPEYFSTGGALVPWRPIDYNGDYLTDMYYYISAQTTCNGYCNMQPTSGSVKLNTGAGNFQTLPISTANFPYTAAYNNLSTAYDLNGQYADVNGDGLQDVTAGSVNINQGGTFSATTFTNPSADQLIDVNGDGLPDSIKGTAVYLNNGTNWNTTSDTKYVVPFSSVLPNDRNGMQFDSGLRFVDMNSDGLVDVVRSYTFNNPGGCTSYSNYCGTSVNDVYINNGNGWVQNSSFKLTNYIMNYTGTVNMGAISWTNIQNDITDVNSDGIVLVAKQDVVKSIVSPLGSKLDVTYKNSVSTGLNPNLPYNVNIVDTIKETETKTGMIETTSYTFEGGKMYADTSNIRDRRYAGFKKVTIQKGNQKIIKYFHQGDGDDSSLFERGDSVHLIGKVFKEETYGTSNNFKYSEVYRNYGVYQYNGQIFQYIKQDVSSVYDGNGGVLSKANVYDYDLAARLPKQVINYGKVNFDIVTNVINDASDDTIVTKNVVSVSRPQRTLSEEKYDANGKFLDKKMYFYDNLPFGYVEKGFVTEVRNYSNANNYIKTNYTYNSIGLKQSETDNNGNITSYNYDAYNNPTSVTNALGQTVFSSYNNVNGLQTYSKSPNGSEVSTVYDGFGNAKATSKTNPVNGALTLSQTESRVFNPSGITVTSNIYSNGSIIKDTITTLDSFGRVVKTQEKVDGGAYKTTDYVYNNLGQLISISYPYSNLWASLGSTMQSVFTYDDIGRVIKQKLGDNESNIIYYVNGKKVYDNTVNTHAKTYAYNTFGKLVSVVEKNGNTDQTTKYTWNIIGNLVNITDAEGNIRNFTYDSEGRLLTQEDLHKSGDNTFGIYKYTYDPIGNLITKTDPSGNVSNFTYDKLYRLVQESGSDFNNVYTYDACSNGVGLLCSITTNDYTENIAYKLGGNILTDSKTIYDDTGDKTFVEGYTYNDLGQLVSVTLPDSSILNYTYNLFGKQKSVSLTRTINGIASTTVFVTDSEYNIDGTQNRLSYGNGLKTCYAYSTTNGGNVAPRLSGIYSFKNNQDCSNLGSNITSSNLIFAEDLSYNLFGQINQLKDKFNGDTGNISTSFQYDDLSRLTSSSRIDANINPNLSVTRNLTYSAIGNILSVDSIGYQYSGSDYANPNAPTLIGNTRMSYDLNGNVLGDGKNLYEWNKKNMMVKSDSSKSTSLYSYDVNGERIKEKVVAKDASVDTNANLASFTDTTYFVDSNIASATSTVYMSQTAYNEINSKLNPNNATMTQQLVSDLVAPVYTSSFVTNTCKGVKSGDISTCQRETTMKALYVKLKKEKGQTVSFGTLSEMWLVFKGQLIVSGEVFTPKHVDKVMDFTEASLKLYFTQQNTFSDYTNQPYCTMMEAINNNYVCNLIFPNTYIPKYTDFTVQKGELYFSSPYVIPASTTKISNLLNINLASTTKFATTSNSNYSFAVASGTLAGYYKYKVDITNIAKAWFTNGNSTFGFSMRNEPATPTNQSYYFLTPYTPWATDVKPKLSLDYIFTGTLNTFNTATTTIVADDSVDSYYQSVVSGITTQATSSAPTTYISESSYSELANNSLASRGKIEAIFAVAANSEYVPKTCMGSSDVNCVKKETIKYVASFLQQKYNIKLLATTLEEMYQVYIGKLILPVSNFPYQKTVKGNYVINSSEASVEGCKVFFTNYDAYPQDYNASWVKNSISTCSDNYFYNTNIWKNTNLTAYLSFDVVQVDARKTLPLTVSIRDASISGTTMIVATTSYAGSYKYDITNAFTAQKNWSNNGANSMSAFNQIVFTTNNTTDLSRKAQIKNVRVTFGEYENLNSINSNVVPSVSQGIIDSEVTNKSNLALLGVMYKEKAIISLFSTAKYVTQETYTELSALGIGYSRLVIYDRLIDASFAGYNVCSSISNSDMKDNCKKSVFVKYLYALAKYETDKDLSTYALDEAYEVVNGNLRMPNDISEYKITEVKSYTVDGSAATNSMIVYTGGSGFTANSGTQYANSNCTISNYNSGGLTTYHMCDTKLPLPQEVIDRRAEISKAELGLSFSQGLLTNNIPYVAPTLTIYPLVSYTPYTYSSSYPQPTHMYNWNTNSNYGTSTVNGVSLAGVNYIDIVKIVKGFASGEINNMGIRFIGNNQYNQTNVTNTNSYELRVTYVKDAPQNSRVFFTPLVLDPKDASVYANVLEVLARIDKNYVGGQNISKDTYNEIKLLDLATSSDAVKQLFQQNMQLQKDQTLAAVWNDIRVNKNTYITREALEELWMVYNDNLTIATSSSIYASTTYPFFDRTKLTNLSVVPGIKSTRELVDDYSFSKLFQVSTDTAIELTNASIFRKSDIIPLVTYRPFTATSTIAQVCKDDTLINIYGNVLTSKNVKLSREALEELYYVWNDKEIMVADNTATNTEKFDRMKFGTLEELHFADTIISSKVEQKLDDNILYTPASTTPTFIISDETRGELGLGGISSKTVLDSIWNGATSTSLSTKDAKLYNLYEKIKTDTNFELSREALEEVYLIETGKVFWNTSTSTQQQVVTTGNIVTNYLLGTTTQATNACNYVGTTANYSTWPTSYPVYTCQSVITVNQIPGYAISNAQLIIPGELINGSANYITLLVTLDGANVTPKPSIDITNSVLSSPNHTLVLNTSGGYINYFITPGMPSVKVVYTPFTTKFSRTNLGELNITSSIGDLQNAYQLATGATSTIAVQDNFTPLTATSSTSTGQVVINNNIATQTIATSSPVINYVPVNNPYGYSYIDNGDGTYMFYLPNGATSSDPLTRIYNSIAKNLGINSTSTLSYTKFYPFSDYEYDTRGVVSINIPFNGKVVGTYKYDTNVNSTVPPEISFAVLNYLGSPVVITDTGMNVTEVIKSDEWGSQVSDSYDANAVIPSAFGFTGHKYDSDSALTYGHARYLSNANRIWLSHDPFSIENFTNGTWLANPQIQNAYSYSSNNPVNMVDPDGKKPSVLEAAYMARDIYSERPGSNLNGLWSYERSITGGNNMVAGIYVRHGADTPNEYSIVFKGTSEAINWSDNLKQPFGSSLDALTALFGSGISDFYSQNCSATGSDCTAVGHSKGGPEASLVGVGYGMDVITFNSARANYTAYGLKEKVSGYNKTIDNYIVKGEILDRTIGFMPLIGSTYVVNPAHTFIGNMKFGTSQFIQSVSSINFLISGYNSYKQHAMDSVVDSLQKAKVQ